MKAIVKLMQVDLDKGRYSAKLNDDIKQQMRMAARAFLNVAVRSIPVRTGFVRGAFRNLAEAAGINQASWVVSDYNRSPAKMYLFIMKTLRSTSFINDAKMKKSGMYSFTRKSLTQAGVQMPIEYYRDGKRRILKTPQSGREFATKRENIIAMDRWVYTFNFEVMISYLNINDVFANPRTPSAPWGAFKAARATFLNYIQSVALNKLPSISSFIVESAVSVNGTTMSRTAFGVVTRDSRFKV